MGSKLPVHRVGGEGMSGVAGGLADVVVICNSEFKIFVVLNPVLGHTPHPQPFDVALN